jgi:hypothetical protein
MEPSTAAFGFGAVRRRAQGGPAEEDGTERGMEEIRVRL